MSDHVRKQIRDYVVERLRPLGLNVFANRAAPLDELHLPAVMVSTDQETSEPINMNGTLSREVSVVIVLILDGEDEGLDDDFDDYATKIETALDEDPPTKRFDLIATSMDLQSDEDGDRWFGFLVLEYRSIVYTRKGSPGIPIG